MYTYTYIYMVVYTINEFVNTYTEKEKGRGDMSSLSHFLLLLYHVSVCCSGMSSWVCVWAVSAGVGEFSYVAFQAATIGSEEVQTFCLKKMWCFWIIEVNVWSPIKYHAKTSSCSKGNQHSWALTDALFIPLAINITSRKSTLCIDNITCWVAILHVK